MTLRSCSWENYSRFNSALAGVRESLAGLEGLSDVGLIDAHSFCWLLARLPEGGDNAAAGRNDVGRVLGSREKSILAMCYAVQNTIKNANGQQVLRTSRTRSCG